MMRSSYAAGVLLAAMLLLQVFEVPVREDLRAVPDWLLPDYTRFLLAMPAIFQRPGDADLYCESLSQAVAAIQSRLPGASPGQLSLAATDAGALSLAEDESGRLSLRDDDKGDVAHGRRAAVKAR